MGAPDAAREAFLGLTTLQHRGQDAAGILTHDEAGFHCVKNLGLVESVFTRANIQTLSGSLAVGHARYSTIGRGDLVDVQPFLLSYPFGIGMVHNGNIVNCDSLAKDLRMRSRRHLLTQSDTEVVLNLFAEGLAKVPTQPAPEAQRGLDPELFFNAVCSSVEEIFKRVNGSYSIATLVADQGMVAFRDPHGIRPLVWGKKKLENGKEAHMVASESVALAFLEYELVRDLAPGEVIYFDIHGRVYSKVLGATPPVKEPATRHCMFEWVYFASPESVMDGIPVYGTRIQLGRNVAHLIQKQMFERGLEADIVVPVPETSRIAAIALAEELKIPYREVLIKNRYIKRTFILDSQEKRQSAVNLKLSPVRSEIEGKRVLLVDDSIVRGTTSKKIIDLVRHAGARRVYFVSTCPPIQYPCYYGIDFPSGSELIASGRNLKMIEQDLGADAVIYQDLEGLERSIVEARLNKKWSSRTRPESSNCCMACLNGRYPTDVSTGEKFASIRNADRSSHGALKHEMHHETDHQTSQCQKEIL